MASLHYEHVDLLDRVSGAATKSVSQSFEIMRAREESRSRLLVAFITSGLFFMLFPGTVLGVWNLLQISGRASVVATSPAWMQAHGHAQVFGWVGSFILGIGFYSIPKLRGGQIIDFVRPGLAGRCGRLVLRCDGSPMFIYGSGDSYCLSLLCWSSQHF